MSRDGPAKPLGAPPPPTGLNRAQREAVERIGRDLLVRAGAGTGKTRVLTHRLHHLVTARGVPVEDILAITFTEKAAAEMKERVAGLFPLGELRERVEFAPISTIHSFCARLLKAEAIASGVDPNFKILEELEARDLLEDAFDSTCQDWLRSRREELGALIQVDAPGGDLLGAIREIYGKVRSTPHPFEGLRQVTEGDRGAILSRIREVRDSLEEGKSFLNAKQVARLEEILAPLDAWLPAAAERDGLTAAREVALLRASIPLNRIRKVPIPDLLKELRDHLLEGMEGTLLDPAAEGVFRALQGFLNDLDTTYTRLKRDRSGLDFADLEREALNLLRQLRLEGRSPHHPFRHILVDEYQDTNPIQEEIIRSLRKGAERFAVGDPIQSIYRFRGAEVRVLLDYQEEVGKDGVITLDETYRPCPGLRQFQNAFFETLLQGTPMERPPLGSGESFDERAGPSVELLLAHGDDARSAREAEAEQIAQRIDEIVTGKEIGFTRQKLPGRGEAVSWGDIAILLRTGTEIQTYERALTARGIRSYIVRGRGFYSTQEVMDLENLLRVVVHRSDETALAALLASPYVGLSDGDLLRFYHWRRQTQGRTPWEEGAGAAELPEGPKGAIRRAAEQVRTLRSVEEVGSLVDLVEKAVALGRHDLVALLQEGGVRRLANLRKVVEIARRLDRDGGYGAPDLVRMMSELRDREIRETEAPTGSEAEDVVKILTVHSAKGLEYPVVIVANANSKPRPETATIRTDRKGGLAFRFLGRVPGEVLEPGGFRRLREEEVGAGEEEEQRLLYVAITRPQEYLIISSGLPPRRLGWMKTILEVTGLSDPPEAGVFSLGRAAFQVRVGEGAGRRSRRARALKGAHREAIRAGAPIPGLPAREVRQARDHWERVGAAATPGDVVPFIVSASDLIRFDSCPRAYFLSVLVGVWAGSRPPGNEETPSPRPGEDDVLDPVDQRRMGTAVHSLLETCDLREGPAGEEVARVLEDELGRSPRKDDLERAGRLVRRFLESPWGERARVVEEADPEAVIREQRFLLRHDELLAKGTIDLILRPAGERPVVIDYKSSSAKGEGEREEAYQLQMGIYSLAVKEILGSPPKAILFYLGDGVAKEVSGEEERVTDVFRRFREAHEGTAPGEGPDPHFPARPTLPRCRACEFLAACPRAALSRPSKPSP